jgi:glutaminyl-tRNA synthetase
MPANDDNNTKAKPDSNANENVPALDFIRQAIVDQINAGEVNGAGGKDGQSDDTATIVTRFPPEPNGFLHIGHSKALNINFGIAAEINDGSIFGDQGTKDGVPVTARCNLRFDDTNPTKEEQRYIDAIQKDIRWLGFDWGEHTYFASDYFDQLFNWACQLIDAGLAYVDDQTADQMRKGRGSLTEPGTPSPFRDRPAEENLELFNKMKAGEFEEGSKVLRAKIDMASPNLNMRDPAMYRILHAEHPRTGNTWSIYPMYDWAHGQSDWIEGVTHSLCSLEFEDHRPLYDWFIDQLMNIGCHPRKDGAGNFNKNDRPCQTEFNRLNVSHTIVTKRKLRTLVDEKHVTGWDDPRMPTLSGLRRRGYPPMALRDFCTGVGLSKRNQKIAISRLEHSVRSELNKTASRVMTVLDPIKVIITNYPEDQVELMDAVNNPEDESAGKRQVPFSREIFIEREDFMIDPPKKFFRLGPGKEVRLRYAYWVKCTDYKTDDAGNVTEIHCTYDPETKGGNSPPPDAEGKKRKVKGTLHWVSTESAVDVEVRLYDTLFNVENPGKVKKGEDNNSWLNKLNPDSLIINTGAKAEPHLKTFDGGTALQFERMGYFCIDSDSTTDKLIANRTVSLKDTWAKMQRK